MELPSPVTPLRTDSGKHTTSYILPEIDFSAIAIPRANNCMPVQSVPCPVHSSLEVQVNMLHAMDYFPDETNISSDSQRITNIVHSPSESSTTSSAIIATNPTSTSDEESPFYTSLQMKGGIRSDTSTASAKKQTDLPSPVTPLQADAEKHVRPTSQIFSYVDFSKVAVPSTNNSKSQSTPAPAIPLIEVEVNIPVTPNSVRESHNSSGSEGTARITYLPDKSSTTSLVSTAKDSTFSSGSVSCSSSQIDQTIRLSANNRPSQVKKVPPSPFASLRIDGGKRPDASGIARRIPTTGNQRDPLVPIVNYKKETMPQSNWRRESIVPPPDKKKGAKNKKKGKGILDPVDEALIKTSENICKLNAEAFDVFKLKKQLLEKRLQQESGLQAKENEQLPIKEQNGYFNLLQRLWLELTSIEQEELFPDVLDILEQFQSRH